MNEETKQFIHEEIIKAVAQEITKLFSENDAYTNLVSFEFRLNNLESNLELLAKSLPSQERMLKIVENLSENISKN